MSGQDSISAADYNELAAAKKLPKYRNVKTVVDGRTYDSKAEARRAQELLWREQAGEITNLEAQPVYPIVVNGRHICDYRADFRYVETATGQTVIEDVKSGPTKTPTYRLKKKLVRAVHGIEITEVQM